MRNIRTIDKDIERAFARIQKNKDAIAKAQVRFNNAVAKCAKKGYTYVGDGNDSHNAHTMFNDWELAFGPIYTRIVKVRTVRMIIGAVWSRYNYIDPNMLATTYKHRLFEECAVALIDWLDDDGTIPMRCLSKFAKECTNCMLNKFGGYLKKTDTLLNYTKGQALQAIKAKLDEKTDG